jgi:3-methyladenine DNA glycosylase/8-oxoguanine DNA glycosylase
MAQRYGQEVPAAATRTLRPTRPLDLARTLRPVRRGGGDPCMRLWADECWRATRTPDGPATLHLRQIGGEVLGEAWGPGAGWTLDGVADLLGLHDDDAGFEPRIPFLSDLAHRFPGLRIGRTRAVAEALAPTIIEQKVTGSDAHRAWWWLVRRLGEAAPGPVPLLLPPAPATLAATPTWVFHRANIERRRAHTITRAMARAFRLEETTAMPMADAYRRLQAFPGIGPWSAAEVAVVALGDPDAVSVGDYHLKNQVSWALAGEERGTDERMVELLEPWRGHRARVLRLLGAGGIQAPRRGARMSNRSIVSL